MRLAKILVIIAGGLALAALPLTRAALLVAGVAVLIATFVFPEVSLYLLVFAVPFASLQPLSVAGMSLTATDVLVGLLAAAWLARSMARREVRPAHAPLILPLLLFLLAQVLSLFDALSYARAAKELIKWSEILVVYSVAAAVLSCREAGRDSAAEAPRSPMPPRLHILVSLVLLAGLAEALLGIYQFIFGAGPSSFLLGRFLRAYGTFAQPNPYAGYLNLSLPLAYALLLAGHHGHRATQRKDAVLIAWLAVVGAAFLMSFSRGAWIGFAVAVMVVSILHSRRTALALAAGSGVLVAIFILSSVNLLPSALTQRFSAVTDYFRIFDARNVKVTDANFAIVERMAHWQAAWYMFNDRPWLGFGIGNYPAAYPRYSLAGWKEDLGHAHNFPLNVAAETGLIGLATYGFFLMAALWSCWQTARAAGTGGNVLGRAIVLGVLGVLLAKITHEMLDDLWVHGMGVQVAILLAMVYNVQQQVTVHR